MLRSACSACRSLLLSSTVDEAAGAIGMQYAACSFIKAVTSRNPHLAFAATRQMSAQGGGAGIVIDDSAVKVSSHYGLML
jgi:dihydroxyacid dehydratase/phosphogluconate dehydratase